MPTSGFFSWVGRLRRPKERPAAGPPRKPKPGTIGGALLLAAVLSLQLHAASSARPPLGILGEPLPAVPADFLWGVATAGYQWEGGDRTSNWASWERAGHVKEPSGRAADGWNRFEADFDLARGLGLNAFRFSLEWSRIEPAPGVIDPDAVAHYHRVFAAARARGLTPIVTLVHYTYPAWLDAQAPKGLSAWEVPGMVEHYAHYVAFVAREFGGDIKYYLTFNEPTVMVEAGYLGGMWPPGKKDLGAFLRASGNLIAAHARAYDVIHAHDADAMVSFNNYAAAYQLGFDPAQSTMRAPGDDWFLKAFSSMLPGRTDAHGRPRLDFVAVDYYKRLSLPVQVVPPSPSQWTVYPDGFIEVLERYHKVFNLPILVAENGFATDNDKPRADGWTREAYLVAHVAAVQRAMQRGIPLLGYTYWTLTDNWEWGSFDDRFGLFAVDCRGGDFARVPRPAAAVYKQIVAAGGATPELLARHAEVLRVAGEAGNRQIASPRPGH